MSFFGLSACMPECLTYNQWLYRGADMLDSLDCLVIVPALPLTAVDTAALTEPYLLLLPTEPCCCCGC